MAEQIKNLFLFSLLFLLTAACVNSPETQTRNHRISINTTEGGSSSVSGIVDVKEGEDFSVRITADQGYAVEQVLLDGRQTEAAEFLLLTDIQADHTVYISFVKLYQITVSSGPGGAVEPSGSFTVKEGDSFSFRIREDRHFIIDSLLLDDEEITDKTGVNLLENIRADHRVSASFRPRKVALVLSVGGEKGLAHIGALDALTDLQIPFHSVFGNSMGAVIGSLYCTNPAGNLQQRYRDFIAAYEDQTLGEKFMSGGGGAVLGGLGMLLLSGGSAGWGTIAGAAAGAVMGARGPYLLDAERFGDVLDEFLDSADMQDTEVPFATSYFKKRGNGLDLIVKQDGNAARAVSRSANNPYIFKNVDLDYVDPGTDRMAAIPVEEAWRLYEPDTVIALNVTDSAAVYSESLPCRVEEIRIDNPEETDTEKAFRGQDPDFSRVYRAGYNGVMNYFNENR